MVDYGLYKPCLKIKTGHERNLSWGERSIYFLRNSQPLTYEQSHKIINGNDHKFCTICEEWKPCNEEYFYKNKSNKVDGFNPYCKECTKIKTRKWQRDNNKAYNEVRNKWVDKHREYKNNEARIWRQENQEYVVEYRRNYIKNNPEKLRQYQLNNAHKKHNISLIEWEWCRLFFEYKCAYCGISWEESYSKHLQDFHKEHFYNDGANDLSNCIPACRECNVRKWEYDGDEWYVYKNEVYSEQRYLRICEWMNKEYKKYINSDVV